MKSSLSTWRIQLFSCLRPFGDGAVPFIIDSSGEHQAAHRRDLGGDRRCFRNCFSSGAAWRTRVGFGGFVGGNLSGLCSVFLLVFAYKSMNANIAFGICTGGGFIAGQLALVLLFRSELSLLQWIGGGGGRGSGDTVCSGETRGGAISA